MDEQAVAGVDRFRSMLLRALVLIGGVVAGTALAWLLSAATASAAESPSPITGLLDTAGSVVDNSVQHTVDLGRDAKATAQALPAAAPTVPALQVPVPQLVTAPVILVGQRLGDLAEAQPVDESVHTAATRTYAPVAGSAPAPRAVPSPPVSRDDRGFEPVAVATPEAALIVPATPLHKDGVPKSEALPFGAPAGNAGGHDGPSSGGGMCLGDGVPVVPAAAVAVPTQTRSRCVPMTARRQPGITPD